MDKLSQDAHQQHGKGRVEILHLSFSRDLFMLDETESSTALKPKISLEMLLRDRIILRKKYFKRYQDAFFFPPHKKMVLIFRGSETPEFLVQTVTTTVTFPHLAGTALSL